jgi:AmmeMemoRadiSam system protein A
MVTMADVLTEKQGRELLRLARKTLETKLAEGSAPLPSPPDDPALSAKAATFVTLKIAGKLRGCIGSLEPDGPLWEGIRDNAINAAFHDHRFSPLARQELPAVHLDISILSRAQPLHYENPEELPAKLRPGVDGVILRDGHRRATFLPQVWQQLPTAEQFLDHLCLKAGLAQGTWRQRKLEILTYQVQCFEEDQK